MDNNYQSDQKKLEGLTGLKNIKTKQNDYSGFSRPHSGPNSADTSKAGYRADSGFGDISGEKAGQKAFDVAMARALQQGQSKQQAVNRGINSAGMLRDSVYNPEVKAGIESKINDFIKNKKSLGIQPTGNLPNSTANLRQYLSYKPKRNAEEEKVLNIMNDSKNRAEENNTTSMIHAGNGMNFAYEDGNWYELTKSGELGRRIDEDSVRQRLVDKQLGIWNQEIEDAHFDEFEIPEEVLSLKKKLEESAFMDDVIYGRESQNTKDLRNKYNEMYEKLMEEAEKNGKYVRNRPLGYYIGLKGGRQWK